VRVLGVGQCLLVVVGLAAVDAMIPFSALGQAQIDPRTLHDDIGGPPDLGTQLWSLENSKGFRPKDLCLIVGRVLDTQIWEHRPAEGGGIFGGSTILSVKVDSVLVGSCSDPVLKLISPIAVWTHGGGPVYRTASGSDERPRAELGDRILAIVLASNLEPMAREHNELAGCIGPMYVGVLDDAHPDTIFTPESAELSPAGRAYAKSLQYTDTPVDLSSYVERRLVAEGTLNAVRRRIEEIRRTWRSRHLPDDRR
jgi:hypothetical protein